MSENKKIWVGRTLTFREIEADYVIDVGKCSKAEVYRNVLKEIIEWPLLRNFD